MKKQSRKPKYILSFVALIFTMSIMAQDIKGTWTGHLEIQDTTIKMSFNISEENGAYTSTFDVPLQGAVDIPLEETSFENNTLTIASSKFKLKYVGTLDGDKLNGTYSQMGQDYPFNLVKTVKTNPGDLNLPSNIRQTY